MSLRLPGSVIPSTVRTGVESLDYELAGEMASTLGRAGHRVEMTLAALNASGDDPEQRRHCLHDAAEAVHAYFIQRELCGMRRHDGVIRDYGIPRAVLARLGAT